MKTLEDEPQLLVAETGDLFSVVARDGLARQANGAFGWLIYQAHDI